MAMTSEDEQQVQKKVPDHVCARCRKPFQPGHRATWAFIIIDPHACNPNRLTERGLEMGTDTEFVHSDCEDPFLSGKSAARIISA